MNKKKNPSIQSMLPWYVSGTLSSGERQSVEKGLSQLAGDKVQNLRTLYEMVKSQPLEAPSPRVHNQLMARIRQTPQPAVPSRSRWVSLYVLASLAVFALLWLVVQPGIVLQWSYSQKEEIDAYRVYRAIQGSNDFVLINEVTARRQSADYMFVDSWLLPSQTYVYKVEAMKENGELIFSSAITGRAMDVFPAQIALLLSSAFLGLVIVHSLRYGWQRWSFGPSVSVNFT